LVRERRDTLLVKRDTATYLPAARLLERALKPTRETSMKTAIAVATAVVLFASISGASAQNLPGKYNVEGKNLDGSAYSGTAEIIATSETTCRIRWETGGTTSEGIWMRNGNSFVAGYVLGDSIGLVVYEMKNDGSLDGV
jgi:hypothetical protein